MPELIEVEAYRKLADRAVGRRIASIEASDAWFLKGGATGDAVRDALVDHKILATRRIGKLLLLDTDGPTLGLRFGMTGRLWLDNHAGVEKLEHSSHRYEAGWDRW